MLAVAFDPDKDTLCDIIRRWAEVQPEAPALLAEGKAPRTYSALAAVMDDIRAGLNASGLGRGDRIGIVHSGGADMMAVMLGVMSGATVVPLNPGFSETELAFHLAGSGVDAVIVENGLETEARHVAEHMGIACLELLEGVASETGALTIRPLAGAQPKPNERALFDDLAMVLSTSGTTSVGKVVPM
ncbi:MAG: AMP-binding protein, partial [Alphaproteobacteria bacterium]|nr:AMP-binding protein [Alphaproteobacteria bacterium]